MNTVQSYVGGRSQAQNQEDQPSDHHSQPGPAKPNVSVSKVNNCRGVTFDNQRCVSRSAHHVILDIRAACQLEPGGAEATGATAALQGNHNIMNVSMKH